MSKSKVSDPITDQEIAFARLILSGGMTDRRAAEVVGLNPGSAAYTKAKPRVRAYMLDHRTAVQQPLVQQEVDLSCQSRRAVEGQHPFTLERGQVLARLWQLANLGPEMTRGSITGQVKSITIIVAMESFIPDRRALSSEKKSAPAPRAQIYEAEWLRNQKAAAQAATNDPQSSPAPTGEENSPFVPEPEPTPAAAPEALPDPNPTPDFAAHRVPLADGLPPYVPDTRVPFSIKKNPFARRRL